MVKQIKTKSGKILAAEVPKDSENFDIHDNDGITYDSLSTNTIKEPWGFIDLNQKDGWHEILGKLSELTDEQCEEFVELLHENFYIEEIKCWSGKFYHHYNQSPGLMNQLMHIAKESFISLLQSQGVDTSKDYLIIKII